MVTVELEAIEYAATATVKVFSFVICATVKTIKLSKIMV